MKITYIHCSVLYHTTSSAAGSCVIRDATGNVTDILIGNLTDACTDLGCNLGWNFTECIQTKCKYGLANDFKVSLNVACTY